MITRNLALAATLFLPSITLANHIAVHNARAPSPDSESTLTAAPARRTPSYDDFPLDKRATPSPLTDYHYPYSALPFQVNPFDVGRGPQSGYNQCNSSTEGPTSQCQTLIVNSISDFCLWGSPTANGTIGDVEADVVSYCTKPGHGGRVMPEGTITGAQVLRSSAYLQIVGTLNQTNVGLWDGDTGGELDPHGDDYLGNPVGGLVYSNGMTGDSGSTEEQVYSWNLFVGSGQFCLKLCDNSITSPNYCENRDDLVGCLYNMPADYDNLEGNFLDCQSDLQDVVGIYVENGQTLSWSEPASLSPDYTLPYQPRVPKSSSCTTYTSARLFGVASSSPTSTPTSSGTGTGAKTTGPAATTGSSSSGSSSPSASSAAGRVDVRSTGWSLVGTMVLMVVVGGVVALI